MYEGARSVWLNRAEAYLQRRQLATRIVRILDDHNSPVARNRGAHAIAVCTENNHQPRHHGEHRVGDTLDKGLSTDLKQRLRIAHPPRLPRRQYDSLEMLRHRGALLRAFEVAEADAECELVALLGTALADNFGDDRDCDFLGRLTANRDPERRVNVGETLFGNSALPDSLERGLHPAARTDHPDEA